MKQILLSFLFIGAFLLIFKFEALGQVKNARQIIRVSPVILNISLVPGKTYKYQIQVENILAEPLPLHTFFDDFVDQNEDGGYDLNAKQEKNPLLEWTHFDEADIILAPHEKRKLTLTIAIPHTVPVGGYYGLAFLEPVPKIQSSSSTVVTARIGILLLANVGVFDTTGEKGKILDFSFNRMIFDTDEVKHVLLRVQNTTLGHFIAKPVIEIRPLFGSGNRQEIEEKIIFPGKVRRWTPILSNYDFPGYYSVKTQVSTGNGEKITASSSYIVLPYKKALLLFPIILLVFVYTRRKKIIHACIAFFRG